MHMPARKYFNKRKELDVQTFRLISKFIMAMKMKMHRLVNLRFVIAASIKMVKASLHGWNGYAWSSNQFRLLRVG